MEEAARGELEKFVDLFPSSRIIADLFRILTLSPVEAPDDKEKTTAYKEAFAREEIMEELLRNVQDRSMRTPFTEDPAEKRQQLVLEELFANRGPILKA